MNYFNDDCLNDFESHISWKELQTLVNEMLPYQEIPALSIESPRFQICAQIINNENYTKNHIKLLITNLQQEQNIPFHYWPSTVLIKALGTILYDKLPPDYKRLA